jgi:hypothetical protein
MAYLLLLGPPKVRLTFVRSRSKNCRLVGLDVMPAVSHQTRKAV